MRGGIGAAARLHAILLHSVCECGAVRLLRRLVAAELDDGLDGEDEHLGGDDPDDGTALLAGRPAG